MISLAPLDITLATAVLAIIYTLYRKTRRRISLANVPGPEPESFIIGNLRQYFQSQAGEIDFKWQELYGDVIRFKGPFGEERLLISDPKALSHIYIHSGYKFPKQPERRNISLHLVGRGADHKRQRKVMEPAFRPIEIGNLLPIFQQSISNLCDKWKDIVQVAPNRTATVDVYWWLAKATLDAIGAAAFDYHFQSLDRKETLLGSVYENLCVQAFGTPTYGSILRQAISLRLPPRVINWIQKIVPDPRVDRLRKTAEVASKVARTLIESKTEAMASGVSNKDVMSLLVNANHSENEKMKMTEEEMISQLRTLMLAGHESTATALSWLLLEVARHPHIQSRLREEVKAKSREITARGDSGFSTTDLDDMPYLTAVIKEALRFHPPAISTYREAGRDDVLPLLKPLVLKSGKIVSELPIPKGAKLVMSINAYNRHKDVWGQDAHVFDPERWLTPGRVENVAHVGVYGNLLTFAGGVRSCIGWRFAVVEMHAFLAELMLNFEVSMTPAAHKIRREAAMVMAPTVEGDVEKGNQLPLSIKLLSNED